MNRDTNRDTKPGRPRLDGAGRVRTLRVRMSDEEMEDLERHMEASLHLNTSTYTRAALKAAKDAPGLRAQVADLGAELADLKRQHQHQQVGAARTPTPADDGRAFIRHTVSQLIEEMDELQMTETDLDEVLEEWIGGLQGVLKACGYSEIERGG